MTHKEIIQAYAAIQKHVQTHVTGGANPKLALWAQDNFGPAQKRPSTLERVGEGFYALSRRKRIIFHKSKVTGGANPKLALWA